MLKTNKRILRYFSVAFMVCILVLTQFSVNANYDAKPMTNEELIKSIIYTKDTGISLEQTSDTYRIDVNMDFKITQSDWNTIKELNEPLKFNISSALKFVEGQELKFENTDKNFKDNKYHTLEDSILTLTEQGFEIDFTEVENLPEAFKLQFSLKPTNGLEDILSVDKDKFPLLAPMINEISKAVNKNLNVTNQDVSDDIADDNSEEIEETPDQPVNAGEKTFVSGSINLELVGNPQARIKMGGRELNDAYPINMDTYSDTATNYTIDLFTDVDSEKLGVAYRVALDDASLAKISELNSETALEFQYLVDGKQEVFNYEYQFPEIVYFYTHTGESIPASLKLADYATSSFDRVNPDENDGIFKLVVDEVKLESNVGEASAQYKLQEYISEVISAYVKEQLEANVSLEDIKTALKDGIIVAEDGYKVSDYAYKQSQKSSFEKRQNYPIDIENILNSGKDINQTVAVTPIGGTNNQIESLDFDLVENGFKLGWKGTSNTNRKTNVEKLNLSFEAPAVVKTSGISNWNIQTTVSVKYYDVLNDGTRVLSTSHQPETKTFTNSSTTKIDDIVITLPSDNVAVEYTVEQKLVNEALTLEVEGKQIGRLRSMINTNLYSATSELSREFPRSIVIEGVKGAEGTPTSLLWNVVYNNNKLLRQSDDGFDFYLDTNKVAVYSYDGTAESYSKLSVNYDKLTINTKVTIDGKDIAEDGRFTVEWNSDFTQAKIRVKPGEVIDDEVKVQFRYDIDVKAPYDSSGSLIRDELKTSAKLKFEGSSNVKSYTHGQIIEPSTPSEEELKAQQALNYLVLLDKRPIMVDYRTKEIIWGVAVNTVTAERIGLPGLTYSDKFGEGLSFEPMSEDNPILMFKFNASNTPQTTHSQYAKLISEVKAIMDDRTIYSEEIPAAITSLLGEPISEDDEDSKVFGDIVEYVAQSDISYLFDDSSTYGGQDLVVTQPKAYPGYVSKLPSTIQNGSGDPYTSKTTKSDLLASKDLRIDFVKSNNAIGGDVSFLDNNAYYIMYKTKLESDKPMDKVKNSASLLYADWELGPGQTIKWTGGQMEASKDLGEVAKYNTIPKKEGTTKVIYDATSMRNRLAVEWTVTFNYDIDSRRVSEVPMVVVDTIDKVVSKGTNTLGNQNLVPQAITQVELYKYTVDKEGNLTATNEKVIVTKDSGELVITDDGTQITYTIEKDLDPLYVYRFTFNTLIDTHDSELPITGTDVSKLVSTGEFSNHVTYTRGSQAGQTDLPTPGEADAVADFGKRNRVSKSGTLVSGSYTGSRQEVLWTLTLNETYENMSDIVITDTLESKHTFKFIRNANDLHLEDTGAKLDRFVVQELRNNYWYTVANNKYTLTNLNGEDKALDNWTTGDSGFVIKFNETMTNPIRIQYATFGQIVDNLESPLLNHADVMYATETNPNIEHKVTASVALRVNDGPGGYENDLMDVGLTLRYNDNQATEPTDLNKGIKIEENNVGESIVVLYRYQDKFASNNHIYRIGAADSTGYVEFKNVEKGSYVVKQYDSADGYAVPNSLGFIESSRNTTKDKSVIIDNNQLLSGNLVTIEVAEKSGFLGLFKADAIQEKIDFAIYNTTPVFEVKTQGVLKNANNTNSVEILSDLEMNAEGSDLPKSNYTSSNLGVFKVGTVESTDPRIDFGTYSITQPYQDLGGYLHNTATVNHTVLRNPNGTVDATSINATFSNYITHARLNVVDRDTQNAISSSVFTLEKFEDNQWKSYQAVSPTKIDNTNTYTAAQGTLNLYNLEVGHYRLIQKSVADGYLVNPEILEFYAYGPLEEDYTDAYEGLPEIMTLSFDNVKSSVNISNVIGENLITGSGFEIRNSSDTVIESFVIDDALNYETKLAPGTYTLHEITTVSNRPINDNALLFTIEDTEGIFEGETVANTRTVVFENHLGSFEWNTHTPTKVDAEIEDFTLLYNSVIQDPSNTDGLGSGLYLFEALVLDSKWIFVDTEPTFTIPTHYTDPNSLHKVVDIYATQATQVYTNIDGDLDDKGVTPKVELTDGTFVMTHGSTGTRYETQLDSNTFMALSPGEYELSQTDAPKGYGLNTYVIPSISVPLVVNPADISIDFDTNDVGYYELATIEYANYRGKVRLTKVSGETNQVLKDVEFKLYYENEALEGSYTTDDSGEINIEHLAPGNYAFEEIKGDGNHTVSSAKTAFTIASSNENTYSIHDVTVSNYYVDITFKNTNPDSSVTYEDGKFTLFVMENGIWKAVDGFINFGITSSDAQFRIFGVKPGTYKLVQTLAPQGTVMNSYEYLFDVPELIKDEVNGRHTIQLDDYINYQAELKVNLVDPHGHFTGDVEATLRDSIGNTYSLVQLQDALYATGLGSGKYTLEIKKADKAIVFDEVITIQVPTQALNEEGLQLETEARMTYARGNISLVDGRTNQQLNSGTYTVNGESQTVLNGTIGLTDLVPGDYEIKQTIAADGYLRNTLNTLTLSVYETASEFDSELINTDEYPWIDFGTTAHANYQVIVHIDKVDDSGLPLRDVEFTLKGTQNMVVTTDVNGKATINKVAPGTYILEESRTPNGYEPLNQSLKLNVAEEVAGVPDDIYVSVTNKKIKKVVDPTLPGTGLSSNVQLLGFVVGLLGCFTLLVAALKKKKH